MAIKNNKKSLEINVVENNFDHDNSTVDVEINDQRLVDDKMVISIGYKLLESVKIMDQTFSGMITNTYFNCVLIATLTLYTTSSVLFQDFGIDLWLNSFSGFMIFVLSMSRLARITQSGHHLMKEMKQCGW